MFARVEDLIRFLLSVAQVIWCAKLANQLYWREDCLSLVNGECGIRPLITTLASCLLLPLHLD